MSRKSRILLPNGSVLSVRYTWFLNKTVVKIVATNGDVLFYKKFPEGYLPQLGEGVIEIHTPSKKKMILGYNGKTVVKFCNQYRNTEKGFFIYERANDNPDHELKSICGMKDKEGRTLIPLGPKEIVEGTGNLKGYLHLIYPNGNEAISDVDGGVVVPEDDYVFWDCNKNCIIMKGKTLFYFFDMQGKLLAMTEKLKKHSFLNLKTGETEEEYYVKNGANWGIFDKYAKVALAVLYHEIKESFQDAVIIGESDGGLSIINKISEKPSEVYLTVKAEDTGIGFAAEFEEGVWHALDSKGELLFESKCKKMLPCKKGVKIITEDGTSFRKWF